MTSIRDTGSSTDTDAGFLSALVGSADEQSVTALRNRLVADALSAGVLDVAYRTVDSPVGDLLLAATEQGLIRVAYASEGHEAVLSAIADRVSPRVLRSPGRLDQVARELDEYFTDSGGHSTSGWTCSWRRGSAVSCSTTCARSATAPLPATASWRQHRAGRQRPGRSARPARGTRFRSWSRVTGSYAATARWAGTSAAPRPSGRSSTWRQLADSCDHSWTSRAGNAVSGPTRSNHELRLDRQRRHGRGLGRHGG